MRRRTRGWLLGIAGILALAAVVMIGGTLLLRSFPGLLDPHYPVRIATGPADGTTDRLGGLLIREWQAGHRFVRLVPVASKGLADNPRLLSENATDLAVIRADAAPTTDWRAVAILQTLGIVVLLPPGSEMIGLSALADKRIALVAPARLDEPLVAAVMAGAKLEMTALVSMAAPDVGRAMATRQIAAALIVSPLGMPSRAVEATATSIARAMRGRAVALDLVEAEAIASVKPVYDAGGYTPASLGAAVAEPGETVSTLSVDILLVARERLPNRIAADVAGTLSDLRTRLVASEPLIGQISLPDLDDPPLIGVHAGVRDYLNGEVPTIASQAVDLYWQAGVVMAILSPLFALIAGRLRGRETDPGEAWSRRLATIAVAWPTADAATRTSLDRELSSIVRDSYAAMNDETLERDAFLCLQAMAAHIRTTPTE
jgi:TRAP-type uncharacterized transport system substrate-binding protein